MKTIGMLGGTGWVSTIEYYRIINETVNERLGGNNFAKCIIYSLNQGEILDFHNNNDLDGIKKLVDDAIQKLVLAGSEMIIVGANTLHMFASEIEKSINIPLINIASATADQILAKNLKKVGLIGTITTMNRDFYKAKLGESGIEVIVPNDEDKEFIHRSIHEELVMDKFYDLTAIGFLEILQKLKDQGAEGIVLGCTEISLLIKQDDVNIPIFDTTRIHANAAVEFALKQ